MSTRLAIVGAGPVGLELALLAADRGFDVRVYEAGRVGESLRSFGQVPLFTPFAWNSTEETRARLRRAGVALPDDGALLDAAAFARRYLEPIAALPVLRDRVHTGALVAAIAREGIGKSKEIATGQDAGRGRRGFLLRVEVGGATRFERADLVVDASGVVGQPLATGPGGLAAAGESILEARADRRLLPSLSAVRDRYAGRRALLLGSGHSAATALLTFEALERSNSGPARVVWAHRARGGTPFPELADDPLPARAALAREANRIAMEAPWLERRPGAVVLGYAELPGGGVRVRLESGGDERERLGSDGGDVGVHDVDRVYALVGYRPDIDLFRELQVHLCYASEAPMALAAALLASRRDGGAGDCLAQTTHGAETLRTTEPGFFVLGAKSYGRSPDFLLRVGYEQARELCGLLSPGVESSREPLSEAV